MTLEGHRLLVYCDESGNAGPNLLDPGQPVYVLAGWVIPAADLDQLTHTIARFISGLALKTQELHAKKFLRTRRGQRELSTFFSLMAKGGALPAYTVAERLYWIAGKIVETFFDSHYNPLSPETFYYDSDKKQELANDICTLPPAYLREFAKSYMSLDRSGLENSVRSFSRLYLLRGRRLLSKMFLGCLPNLEQIIAGEDTARKAHASGTVNVPVLVAFLSNLEKYGRALDPESIDIVHDESIEFSPAYEAVHERYRAGKLGIQLFHSDESRGVFELTKINSFKTAASCDSPLIQAADLLATTLQAYAAAYAQGQSPRSWLAEAVIPIIEHGLGREEPSLGYLIGSPSFLKGFFSFLTPAGDTS